MGQTPKRPIVDLDYTQPGNTQLTSVLDLVGAKVRITATEPNQNQNATAGRRNDAALQPAATITGSALPAI